MDGHFDSNDRFSGTGDDDFHRHSHCSTNHFDFDFSVMHAQQTANEAARLSAAAGGAYESHDDLCVDRCMGVGLYNGFQQFNHRGGPPSLQNRWPRDSQDYPMGLNDLSMQFRAADMAPPAANLYQQQSWYTHQLDPCVPCADEDCHSMADTCCDSECTMTDKCTDVACADTEDACTDQTCPERSALPVPASGPVPTSEVVSGAAALISINHAPEDSQSHYGMQHQVMGDLGFGLSSPPQQPYLFPPDFLPGQLGNITNHLLVAHGDTSSSSNCTDSCPLDDPQIYQYCHMPLPSNPAAFGQFNPVGSAFQINQSFVECGAEIHDAESFLMHFNAQHRPYFTASTPNPLRAPAGTRHNGHALASTEVMSPPATPLDTSDSGRSSATPSPLTPLSNSVEMTDAKPDSSLHLRGTSTASSVDRSLDLAAEEEHRCLWRDEGSSRICGQLFEDSEELFKHASETHIKHAQKGVQGFRCGWDDCPRSEIGATGFPQRSKIERHMQTHIGHKPHICPTCNKGFSAKQALTQHMFIHSNEKPLVCNICHKAFRYPSALTMHQRVHSGLKPLKCPVCGKGFSESSNLSKHKRTHEVKGRFTCTVPGCDRNFHRQDQLRRHMKTHQKDGEGRPMSSSAASVDGMFDQSPQS